MEQFEILKRKIDNENELKSLVRTMKTLAAVSIREYGQMVGSLHQYHRAIDSVNGVKITTQFWDGVSLNIAP